MFEAMKLHVGAGLDGLRPAFYCPDFAVWRPLSRAPEFHETKGFRFREQMAKLKAAALVYPEFLFVLVEWKDSTWTKAVLG